MPADGVVGYSRLMEIDEETGTLVALNAVRRDLVDHDRRA
jgi:hypothetical protein